MSRPLTSLTLVLALAAAAPAAAQPAPWEPERLTAGWVFTPAAVFGTTWDSNVTLQNVDTPRTSTWLGTVSPRGEMNFNGRRTFFNAGYAGSLQVFQDFSELNRYEQHARSEVRHRLSRRLDLRTWANLTVAPTTDRLRITPGAIPFVEVGSRTFDVGGTVTARLTARTSLEGFYDLTHVRFDEDDAIQTEFVNLAGGHAHNPSVMLTQNLTSRLSVGGSWNYVHGRIKGALRPFDIHTAIGHATYQVHQYTSVSGGAGISHVREASEALQSSGLALRANLDQRVGSAAVISVNYAREYVPSYGFGGVDPTQSLAAGARVSLLQNRLGLSGSVAYGNSDSLPARDPLRPVADTFELEATSIDVALAYQFARWLRGEVFYNGLVQRTNVQGNMDRTRIGVQFVTLKPVRMQ